MLQHSPYTRLNQRVSQRYFSNIKKSRPKPNFLTYWGKNSEISNVQEFCFYWLESRRTHPHTWLVFKYECELELLENKQTKNGVILNKIIKVVVFEHYIFLVCLLRHLASL